MDAHDGKPTGITHQDSHGRRSAGVRLMLMMLGLLGFTQVAAQTPPTFSPSANPVSDVVREMLARQATNLTRSAELMPPEKYGFSPTPAQMTFGQLIVHIIQTNTALCSAASGLPAAMLPDQFKQLSATDTKEALTLKLRQSFDDCKDKLSKIQDASLAAEALVFGQRTGMSSGAALVTITADWADHYSTAATYLRLNGILPPTAQPPR